MDPWGRWKSMIHSDVYEPLIHTLNFLGFRKLLYHHRDLCVWILYHKHMIISHVSHQAVLTQREKRVIRSS